MNNLKRKTIEDHTNEIIDHNNNKSKVISTKETAYHCNICDKYYASYKSYGNHTRSYHGKNKEKSKCPYCGNCFTRRDNLQQHIKLFHSSIDKQFVCSFCGELFTNKSNCLKHKEKCVNTVKDRDFNSTSSHSTNGAIKDQHQQVYKYPLPGHHHIDSRVDERHMIDEKPVHSLPKTKSKSKTMPGEESCFTYLSDFKRKLEHGLYCDCKECHVQKASSLITNHKTSHNGTINNSAMHSQKSSHISTHSRNASQQIFIGDDVNNDFMEQRNDMYSERRVLQYAQQNHYVERKEKHTAISLKENFTNGGALSLGQRRSLNNINDSYANEKQISIVYDQENRLHKDDRNGNSYLDNRNGTFGEENCVSEALDCTYCNITFLTRYDYENHKPYCVENVQDECV